MKTLRLFGFLSGALLATALLSPANLTAKTIGHWSFNGTLGTTFAEGDVIPDLSPDGNHPITLGRFTSPAAGVQWYTPVITNFMAAPYNAWRETQIGETHVNNTAYSFNTPLRDAGAAQGRGSCLRVAQTPEDPLDFQTFTIEFFWNNDFPSINPDTQTRQYFANWTAPFSRVLKVTPKVKATDAPDTPSAFSFYFSPGSGKNCPKLVYSYSVSDGTTTTVTTNVTSSLKSVENGYDYDWKPDGKWHHFALVVDGSTHLVKLFIDRVHVASLTLPGDIYYGEEKALHPWCFGGHDVYGWAMVGRIDEIRISDQALDATQFIQADLSIPEGEALVYMPLDGDFLSVVHPEWNPDGTGMYEQATAAKVAAGKLAFTNDFVQSRIADGENKLVRRGNIGSVYMDDARAQTSAWPFQFDKFNPTRVTIEFFTKVDVPGPGKWAQVFEIWDVTPNNHYPVCVQQNGNPGGMNIRIDTSAWGGVNGVTTGNTISLPSTVYDGQWHHVAFTIDCSAGTSTTVEAFLDYQSRGSKVIQGIWKVGPKALFHIGNSDVAACSGQKAYLDELRISRGLLPVSAFLRQTPAPGTGIVVR